MYVEEFTAVGPLSADEAQELADIAGRYTSRITVSCGGHDVHALVLPVAWDELPMKAGSRVTVTVEGGRQGPEEDRKALRDFVCHMQHVGD
ncbi:hypothetical protein ACFYT3_13775 [Nocardia amikacinitolerans]|uniref:hypothetical protein n=1 Tax=Nocardia amikacinitolerans TaxID=756689 RepID=UPI0020A2CE96|nr:hypothetical protein [Nocardia amikacinitolerans]MCP2290674.1 hypothetical protein [Nocardia amikacinitolerans]